MASNKPEAIVLGGIVSHIPVITKLQDRGYYVILVDYLNEPPAKRFADEHVQISTFDEPAIYDLAKSRHVRLIVNCCLEHLNVIISNISEKLGLPCLYSSNTALDVSDKSLMKKKMIVSGIPTSKYACVSNVSETAALELTFPLYVKPSDGSGSNGVYKVENTSELSSAFHSALSYSKTGKVIIEEEAPGLECNVYCIVKDGQSRVLMISSKYSEIHNSVHANTKCICTYAPAPISDVAKSRISMIAQRIADEFSLRSTPMFIQLMIDNEEVSVIEFACRVPGGYSYRSILSKLQFDYFDFTLDVLLGVEPNCFTRDSGAISLVHSFYAYPCILNSVVGVDRLIDDGTLIDVNIAREAGTAISEETGNREKVGHFVIEASCPKEAFQKVDRFFDEVKVLDSSGCDQLRHDLRLTEQLVFNSNE